MENGMNEVVAQNLAAEEGVEDIFSTYISSEPSVRLPFTGPSLSVGRTSTFACSTCGTINLT
jgi:hypothetical protein